ncbi:MAG: helix-turn-helix domain-containing protein [Ruminococcus sp.]|nr:helix-turn-helix domain-containing protein [Ruminococcus sp.]
MLYRVLVVDNANFDLRHYRALSVFEECGFEMTAHTPDPAKACEAAAAYECDMLLCINRPSAVIATDLLKRLSRARLKTPVVIISKVNMSGDMRECFLLGAVDYLTEPALEDDIRAALNRSSKAISRNIMTAQYENVVRSALAQLPAQAGSDAFTEKLLRLLEKTQGSAVTVEAAADHFGFNPDYFGRYFKARAGISFTEFYKQLSMEYAKLLLSSGHYKVSEVSSLLGYASADYFSHVFKRVTGRLPSEFKR